MKQRLPRARGDRPKIDELTSKGGASPPRTRGSTRNAALLTLGGHVSPRARGDRPAHFRASATLWPSPRARGDRPRLIALDQLAWVSPPRTRGSTSSTPGKPTCRTQKAAFLEGQLPSTIGTDGFHQTRCRRWNIFLILHGLHPQTGQRAQPS